MYEFTIPRSKKSLEIEQIFDRLIMQPFCLIDGRQASKLGKYAKDLRKKDQYILHISTDHILNENIAILKVNNYVRPGSVKKRTKKKKIVYEFKDLFAPIF